MLFTILFLALIVMSQQPTGIPDSMTAIEISKSGSPDVLKPVEKPVPKPFQDEVLVKVAAAGINGPDLMQRKGLYPPPPGATEIPGLEIAGTIAALGDKVDQLTVGQEVCALVTGGGYAEYCTAAAVLCLPVPVGLNMIQAAALPETFFTVWNNVFERGKLVQGEHFLVHGGTSGIGTTAIQLARVMGAKVFATAGSDVKCRVCEQLGAAVAINYKTEDFVDRVKADTDNAGVDLILDMVGGDYLQRNLTCLATDGRLVQIAFQRSPKTNINLAPIMLKRLTLTGSTLRPRSIAEKAVLAEGLKQKVWPLLEAGSVRPIIHETFALRDASTAHQLMESSEHIGKIVLTVG